MAERESRSRMSSFVETPGYKALLSKIEGIRNSGRSASVIQIESKYTIYEVRIGEQGESIGRMVYCRIPKPGEEGKYFEKVAFVGKDVTADAFNVISNPNTYPHKILMETTPEQAEIPDEIRMRVGMLNHLYDRMFGIPKAAPQKGYAATDGPVFGFQSPRESSIDIKVAEAEAVPPTAIPDIEPRTGSTVPLYSSPPPIPAALPKEAPRQAIAPPPTLEQAVELPVWEAEDETIELGKKDLVEVREDDVSEWPELEDKEFKPLLERPSETPAPKRAAMAVKQRSLAEIAFSDIDEEHGGSEQYVMLEAKMVERLAELGLELATMEYERFIVLEKDRAFDLGPSKLFDQYRELFDPDAEITLQERKGLMSDYCAKNNETINIIDFTNPEISEIVEVAFPKSGEVAVYTTDEALVGNLMMYAMDKKEKGAKDVVDRNGFRIRLNGTTLNFVGRESREVFKKCDEDLFKNISDLVMKAADMNPKRGFSC